MMMSKMFGVFAGIIAVWSVWALAATPATCLCPSHPAAVQKAADLGIPFLAAAVGAPLPDLSGCDGTFATVQGAVDAAPGLNADAVIGVYNAGGARFRENVVIDDAGQDLRLVGCQGGGKVVAADPALPTMAILPTAGDGVAKDASQPGERDIEVTGLNMMGSQVAGYAVDGHGNVLLKGGRAEENAIGAMISGQNQAVRGMNGLSENGVGIQLSGEGHSLRTSRMEENTGAGVMVVSGSHALDGNKSHDNGAEGYLIQSAGNVITSNRAEDNAGPEFVIAAGNGGAGNKANDRMFDVPPEGGSFD